MRTDRNIQTRPSLQTSVSHDPLASGLQKSDVENMKTQDHIDDRYDASPVNLHTVEIESETSTRAVRIRPQGPLLDQATAQAVIKAANGLTDSHHGRPRKLILDARELVMPSSLVVGMLLEIVRIAEKNRMEAVLHGPNQALIDLLRMLQLDGRYTMSMSQRELDRAMAA